LRGGPETNGMSDARLPYTGHRHTEPRPDAPALEVRDLVVAYPGMERPAVRGVSLVVAPGTRVALVGGNGSGKSTLLKAVAGVLPPRGGTVLVMGSALGCCRHRVAYLPQHEEIDWRFPMTVERLVLTGRYSHLGWLARPGRRDREVVERAMAQVGVTALGRRQIGRLSGGQRQRVLLARALASEAGLLLLDEPLTAMDAEARAQVGAVLGALSRAGTAMVVATHDLGSLDTDFDDALHLADGRASAPPPAGLGGLGHHREASWTG
jgi:ABC-type Mn2+/Zn2+ transport system ATPase subunit